MATLKPTQSYHHGDLRNALIRTCLAVLVENGVEALSLREVARRAGVSHTACYRHFADREALLAAVAAEGFERLQQDLTAASIGAPDAVTALQRGLHAYLNFGYAHPQYVQLMFGIDMSARQPALKDVTTKAFDALVQLVTAALPTGSAPKSRSLALALWAEVHGLLVLSTALRLQDIAPGDQPGDAARLALDALFVRIIPVAHREAVDS